MAKIHKFQDDITKEVADSFRGEISIDCEATGLDIPQRDSLSLVQICDQNGVVYIVQPDRKNYKAPNLVKVLEDASILKIGHYLRFDKSALEFFLKCKIKNIFDNDAQKHGKSLFGCNKTINMPDQLHKVTFDLILIAR